MSAKMEMETDSMETATSARSDGCAMHVEGDDIEGSGDGERRERGLDEGDREAESTKHLSFLFAALEVRRVLLEHGLCVRLDGMGNHALRFLVPCVYAGTRDRFLPPESASYSKRFSKVSCSKCPTVLFKFVSLCYLR